MFSIFTVFTIASDSTFTQMTQEASQEMAGANIYIVLIVTLIVWGGLFFYLMYLDRKLKHLKNKIDALRR